MPVIGAALAIGGAAVAAWARAGGTADGSAVIALPVTIVFVAAAGCVLALARPDNRIGWVLVVTSAAWGIGEGLFDVGIRGIVTLPRSVGGASWYAVAGAGPRAIGWFATALAVPMIFPDGHLPGRRWRWLGWTLVAGLAATFIGGAFDTHLEDDQLAAVHWTSPLPVPHVVNGLADACSALALVLMAVAAGGSIAGIAVRWRRGDALIRRQLVLLIAAAALPVIVIPSAFTAGWPSWIFAATVLPLPVAVTVAVLTGGVFDLATVANRSLVWGTLSIGIVGIYALSIAGTGAFLGNTHARWLPWLGATLVAITFAPLRQALQNAANRITFGRWREPYAVLTGLGSRIEGADDTDRVLADVVTELGNTLGLQGVALRDPAGVILAGAPNADPIAVPLIAYRTRTGELLYTEPATPLRPADRRVLDDLAAQLALLMHARSLTETVRAARERLVLAREEERRRLRRDLHDGLGPALAGLMLKVDNARALVPDDPSGADHDLLLLRQDIQATVVDVRRLVEGLRPPAIDELGLGPALVQAISRLASRSGTTIRIDVDDPLPALPAAIEVAAYRIVAEAVTNVVRHAHAGACVVTVAMRDDVLVVDVGDDGDGLDRSTLSGNGLVTMRERAEELGGSFAVRSDQTGTTVAVALPVPSGPIPRGSMPIGPMPSGPLPTGPVDPAVVACE
ncbi:MAG TPA: histidine kinase [Micromonosporaceae bacterium]